MGKTRATAGARGREPTTEHKTQTNKATMQALRTKPTKKTAAKAKPAKKPTGLPSFNFGAKKTSAKSTKTATKVSPFSFGSKPKQPAAKKSVAPTGPAAQSFEIRIPGQFFQARKDIVEREPRLHQVQRALRRQDGHARVRGLPHRGDPHRQGRPRPVRRRDRPSPLRHGAPRPRPRRLQPLRGLRAGQGQV